MEPKYLFAIITILVVGVIQVCAFLNGIDGQVFTACMAIISALIGYILKGEIDISKQLKTNSSDLNNIHKDIQDLRNTLNK